MAERRCRFPPLVAMMRKQSALMGYGVSAVVIYAIIASGTVLQIFPATAIAALLPIPMAVKIWRLIKAHLGNPYGLMPAMSLNIKLYAYTTLLLLAGYIASVYFSL